MLCGACDAYPARTGLAAGPHTNSIVCVILVIFLSNRLGFRSQGSSIEIWDLLQPILSLALVSVYPCMLGQAGGVSACVRAGVAGGQAPHAVPAEPLRARRNPLTDTVRHSVPGSLKDETCHFRGCVLAEALVHNNEPCHLRGFKLCPLFTRTFEHRTADPGLPLSLVAFRLHPILLQCLSYFSAPIVIPI